MSFDRFNEPHIWRGCEVENTPFRGMNTIFVNRLSLVEKAAKIAVATQVGHLYICAQMLGFFDNMLGGEAGLQNLRTAIAHYTRIGLNVTAEISQFSSDRYEWAELRCNLRFCLMVNVSVACPLRGNVCLKAEPVRRTDLHSDGVLVASLRHDMLTSWQAYNGDTVIE